MLQAILEFFTELLKFLGRIFTGKKAGDVIVKTAKIYDNMRTVVLDPQNNVERFLVIMAHNGGGDIKSCTPAYVSVIHEEVRNPVKSVKSSYQQIALDGEYAQMLRDIYINGFKDIDVNTMPDCLLKNVYQSEGVEFAKVCFLHHEKKGFWFCSIATTQPNEKFDRPITKLAITLAVNNIKNIMK